MFINPCLSFRLIFPLLGIVHAATTSASANFAPQITYSTTRTIGHMTVVTVGYGYVAEKETIDSLDFIVSSSTSGAASTPTAISSLNTTALTDSVTEATTYRHTLSTTVTFAHITVITFKYDELAAQTLRPLEFIATKLHAYNPTTEELTFFVVSDGLGVYGDWPVASVSSYSQALSTSSTYALSTSSPYTPSTSYTSSASASSSMSHSTSSANASSTTGPVSLCVLDTGNTIDVANQLLRTTGYLIVSRPRSL